MLRHLTSERKDGCERERTRSASRGGARPSRRARPRRTTVLGSTDVRTGVSQSAAQKGMEGNQSVTIAPATAAPPSSPESEQVCQAKPEPNELADDVPQDTDSILIQRLRHAKKAEAQRKCGPRPRSRTVTHEVGRLLALSETCCNPGHVAPLVCTCSCSICEGCSNVCHAVGCQWAPDSDVQGHLVLLGAEEVHWRTLVADTTAFISKSLVLHRKDASASRHTHVPVFFRVQRHECATVLIMGKLSDALCVQSTTTLANSIGDVHSETEPLQHECAGKMVRPRILSGLEVRRRRHWHLVQHGNSKRPGLRGMTEQVTRSL